MASPSDLDEKMMRRAIRLAMNGRGRVEPNPMVACVIVKNGRVIGEGYHSQFGGPHAEPTALANCTESPEGATAYVTLEPCCHTKKKTPPCAPKLIEAKIAHVIVGSADPNPEVNGNGIDMLRRAGIEVETNFLDAEAKQLLAPFVAHVVYDRPYVTLKWAETADGKVAGAGGRRMRISNEHSDRVVHGLRSRCDAIMIGINTALFDDPLLTARVHGPRKPMRIVLDRELRLPANSKLARTANSNEPVTVYCSVDAYARREVLVAAGVHVVPVGTKASGLLPLEAILTDLSRQVTHLLVEPGPTLANSFFDAVNLIDRIWEIRSPKKMNELGAPAGVGVPPDFVKTGEIDLSDDRLTEYLNPASPVFFSRSPSADFVLASAGP